MLGKLIPVQGGDSIYLALPEVTVGSDEGCDVVIQHRSVEPLHCTLEYHDGTWFVEDHGTGTGVRVDGDRFDSTYIPVYSVLSIGTVQFEVHYRAGAPVAVGADSEASNVWPAVSGETGPQFSSGGQLAGEEDELLLAPDDDSGLNLQESQSHRPGNVQADPSLAGQRPAFKRLGFLSPVDGEAPHRLLKERLYLGRDSECDVVIPGLDVAPLHCVMELRDGYWHVRNLKDNGVAIDGKKLSESWLVPGAVLAICGHEFSVDYEPDSAAPVSEATADAIEDELAATGENQGQDAGSSDSSLSHGVDVTSGSSDSASETEPTLSLAELAAEADNLFESEVEPDLDVSVAERPTANASDENHSSVEASGNESADLSDDSRTELATSRTFLLFENPDDEPSSVAESGTTAVSLPEHGKTTPRDDDQLATEGTPEAATADSDFELKASAGSRSEMPDLFSEDAATVGDGTTACQTVSDAEQISRPRSEDDHQSSDSRQTQAKPTPATRTSAGAAAPLYPDSSARTSSGETKQSRAAALAALRREQIVEYLEASSLDGLILTRPSSIAWLTAGIQSGPELSGSAALVITRDECSLLIRDFDAPALARELASTLQFRVKPYAWREPLALQLEHFSSTGKFASDGTPWADVADAALDLARMRLPMERPERRELRRLGHQVAHAVEATLRNFHRGATEAEIVGQLSNRLFRHGVTAEQIQVYADDRRGSYRRAKFDRRPVEDGCTLSVTARRNGLHVAASRTVCFGTPDRQILDDHALSLVVQSTSLVFSKHEWPIADVWKRVHRIYEKFDRADESLRVEPGWVTGYEPSEVPILPDSDFQLLAGMPVIWQAGVGTALSVDTVLIANGGIDILTPCEFWPTRRVAVKRIELQRPDILIRNDS